ncbi:MULTISPECIES: DUF4141 domain-containing protein [Lysobacter]|uniref:DUF4141 domain-containing protein n=1 Tax=Lysobacter firmicutimachus TaxID=1792846 RepID=A0ABU8D3D7_9GAMM|nr:DUF4141 domain-containing protein [Lysobacter antibioticus]
MKTMNAKQAMKKNLAVAVLAAGCVLGIGSANAQWVVTDPGHTIQNIVTQIKGFAERYGQHIKEYTKLQQQVQHFQQQVIQISSMLQSIGMPTQQPWAEISNSERNKRITDRCSTGGGGLLGSLASVFKLNPNGDLAEQQKQICANIVTAKVDKYNYTVRFATQTLPQIEKQIKDLESQRKQNNKQGNLETVANDSTRLANSMSASFQIYQGQMQAYDNYVLQMEDEQRELVKTAMKGRNDILGSVFKGVALDKALN